MKKRFQNTLLICFVLLSYSSKAQSISGNLKLLANQIIKLEGFDGLKTYTIATAAIDEKGNFILSYNNSNYGVGYLLVANETPLFVILSGENIALQGDALSLKESINITKGTENQLFEQYAKEHPLREQALSAWVYLEKIYTANSLFALQKTPVRAIKIEQQRLKTEDAKFLSTLPNESYINWFLPIRKLVSDVSTIAQYRTSEIPATIAAFRALDYTDQRLYKSGLFKDAIESHFWLLENSGKSLDTVFSEMNISIDAMLVNLVKDNKKLNEVTSYLFDLLERHSLFQASEYLALKVLNETSCTIDTDLAKQLESYRAMKKGNIAPNINFNNASFLNGVKQTMYSGLADITAPYTLVVFGAGWCPKCKEELPSLVNNYSKWRNSGVEVVYVSLDTNQNEFEKAANEFPFITYCDFKKWDSQVAKDYYVFGTPTFYLLNNKREIVLRPNSSAQVDAWVDWYLIKGNK
jgi:thiol-disulfide isomerase/thioredoxin